MCDHVLESSHRDESNKWSNIGFVEEILQIKSIDINFMHLIWILHSLNFVKKKRDKVLNNFNPDQMQSLLTFDLDQNYSQMRSLTL